MKNNYDIKGQKYYYLFVYGSSFLNESITAKAKLSKTPSVGIPLSFGNVTSALPFLFTGTIRYNCYIYNYDNLNFNPQITLVLFCDNLKLDNTSKLKREYSIM